MLEGIEDSDLKMLSIKCDEDLLFQQKCLLNGNLLVACVYKYVWYVFVSGATLFVFLNMLCICMWSGIVFSFNS